MSSNLPCVATRLPGSTDGLIQHGVNGLLVEPDDTAGFAEPFDPAFGSGDGGPARLPPRETVIER